MHDHGDDRVGVRTALGYARPGTYGRSQVPGRYVAWVVAATAFPAAMTVYCHVAGRVCQARVGQNVLCEGATGTPVFDLWLVQMPALAATAWAVGVALAAALVRPRPMLPPSTMPGLWVVVCPSAAIAWMLFLIACFPVWDDVSP